MRFLLWTVVVPATLFQPAPRRCVLVIDVVNQAPMPVPFRFMVDDRVILDAVAPIVDMRPALTSLGRTLPLSCGRHAIRLQDRGRISTARLRFKADTMTATIWLDPDNSGVVLVRGRPMYL